VLSRQNFKK